MAPVASPNCSIESSIVSASSSSESCASLRSSRARWARVETSSPPPRPARCRAHPRCRSPRPPSRSPVWRARCPCGRSPSAPAASPTAAPRRLPCSMRSGYGRPPRSPRARRATRRRRRTRSAPTRLRRRLAALLATADGCGGEDHRDDTAGDDEPDDRTAHALPPRGRQLVDDGDQQFPEAFDGGDANPFVR